MLLRSLDPGRYAAYSQFETIRKLRSAYSNAYLASAKACEVSATMGRASTKYFLTQCPTQSLWFERFAYGCLKRMGQVIKRDLAISIEVMTHLMHQLETDFGGASPIDLENLIMTGAYCVMCFCGSFRGHEVFLTDLDGLIRENLKVKESGKDNYVIIPLLGRFKGETGERYHLTPLAAETKSGLKVKFLD